MTNNIQLFKKEEFGEVRVLDKNGEVWFVAKDVCEALGYANTRDAIATHVDNEDRNTVAIYDGNKGNPNQVVINESGLYALIFGSKLEKAKQFKRWVTSEVLPAIRKTGQYSIKNTIKMTEAEIDKEREKIEQARRQGALAISYLLNKKSEGWIIKFRKYLLLGLNNEEISKLLNISAEQVDLFREVLEMTGLYSDEKAIVNLRDEIKNLHNVVFDANLPFSRKILEYSNRIFEFINQNTTKDKKYFLKKDIVAHIPCKTDDFYAAMEYLVNEGKIRIYKTKGRNNVTYIKYYSPEALIYTKIDLSGRRKLTSDEARKLEKRKSNEL